MNKRGGIVFTVAALLALTACSASPDSPVTEEVSAPISASASPSSSPEAAPLNVASAPASDDQDVEGLDGEQAEEFYFKTFDLWKSEGRELPDDDGLLAAGYEACKQIDSGVGQLEVVAVKGDSEYAQDLNSYVRASAVSALCPEHL